MKDTDFIEASEILSKQRHHIIKQSTLSRVAASASFLEAVGMLTQNTDYDFSAVRQMDEVNFILDHSLEALYVTIGEICPHPIIVDILSSRYDFSNLKQAIHTSFLEDAPPPRYILTSSIPKAEFDAFADSQNDLFESTLPSHLLNGGIDARAVFEETASSSLTETYLDRKMYAWMLLLAEAIDNDFITNYVQTAIDCYNISILMNQRSAQRQRTFLEPYLIQGGRTSVVTIAGQYSQAASAVIPVYYHKYFGEILRDQVNAWEKKGDPKKTGLLLSKMLYAMTQNTKYIAYGAEVVFSYLLSRENEIETIRFLLTSKAAGVSPKTIQQEVENLFLLVKKG